MTTNQGSSFEQEGNDLAVEVGKLGQLADELTGESKSCAGDQEAVGSWVTTIGKALLAIFGIGTSH